jgi:hypothetical protein
MIRCRARSIIGAQESGRKALGEDPAAGRVTSGAGLTTAGCNGVPLPNDLVARDKDSGLAKNQTQFRSFPYFRKG